LSDKTKTYTYVLYSPFNKKQQICPKTLEALQKKNKLKVHYVAV
jgi:hypothetical protein